MVSVKSPSLPICSHRMALILVECQRGFNLAAGATSVMEDEAIAHGDAVAPSRLGKAVLPAAIPAIVLGAAAAPARLLTESAPRVLDAVAADAAHGRPALVQRRKRTARIEASHRGARAPRIVARGGIRAFVDNAAPLSPGDFIGRWMSMFIKPGEKVEREGEQADDGDLVDQQVMRGQQRPGRRCGGPQ
eukprot:gene8314-11270_t